MSVIVGDFLGDLSGRARGGNQLISYNVFESGTSIYGDVSGVIRDQAGGGADQITATVEIQALFGDASGLANKGRGGDDRITVAAAFDNVVYGDAYAMSGASVGGRDMLAITNQTFDEGNGSINTLYGDAHAMTGKALGGDDVFSHQGFGTVTLYGDAFTISEAAKGGRDVVDLFAWNGAFVFGDADTIAMTGVGGSDTLTVYDGEVRGDARLMQDSARGGWDKLYVGADGSTTAWGDADRMIGHAKGGADLISFLESTRMVGTAYGDGGTMADDTIGGNDTIEGGEVGRVVITAYGDAGAMTGRARGGHDTINLTGFGEAAYGDARTMTDETVGGADRIFGRAGVSNTIVGDAETMTGHAKGGKDVLTLGDSIDSDGSFAYGDAITMAGAAAGSDDRLVSGRADDDLWGDGQFMFDKAKGGKDTFVFLADNGHDRVHDFKQGMDKIELRGTAAHGFADLVIEKTILDGKTASLVHLDAGNDVTVVTSATLKASDFLFFV
ncbi:MAG: hypothetical protein ABW003_27690 [Microvirga sp.]